MLACLQDEKFNEFIPATGDEECLLVRCHAVYTLLAEFLQGVYLALLGEFWLEELWMHKLLALFSFND